MLTCKSPRKVTRAAYRLAQACLPTYSNEFSRHDFTLPQLFACLVLREHQKKSYRGVQELIEDSADWRADIGLSRTPNHNTLWRAFNQLIKPGIVNSMLDLTARWAEQRQLIRGRVKPVKLDSSMFESRQVSRHFEKRQRQIERDKRRKTGKYAEKAADDRRRSRVVRSLPKLSLAVASNCHVILAARATTGGGADQPFFEPLLTDARRRAKVGIVVADAGYDGEPNHRIARDTSASVRSSRQTRVGPPVNRRQPGIVEICTFASSGKRTRKHMAKGHEAKP
jgi:hypothetical protein